MENEGTRPRTHLKIWTDGAFCNWTTPMAIGMAAVYCYRSGKQTTRVDTKSWKVLANTTSSMHAELYSIVCALENLPRAFRQHCKITVLTDCLEAVRAIKGHLICSRYRGMVKHIRTLLRDFPHAKIIWCKSHSGYKWNELANELAKKEAGTWKGQGSFDMDRQLR